MGRYKVCIYAYDESYGGPEEGGWYYTRLVRVFVGEVETKEEVKLALTVFNTFKACDSTGYCKDWVIGVTRRDPKYILQNPSEGVTYTDLGLIATQTCGRVHYC